MSVLGGEIAAVEQTNALPTGNYTVQALFQNAAPWAKSTKIWVRRCSALGSVSCVGSRSEIPALDLTPLLPAYFGRFPFPSAPRRCVNLATQAPRAATSPSSSASSHLGSSIVRLPAARGQERASKGERQGKSRQRCGCLGLQARERSALVGPRLGPASPQWWWSPGLNRASKRLPSEPGFCTQPAAPKARCPSFVDHTNLGWPLFLSGIDPTKPLKRGRLNKKHTHTHSLKGDSFD